MVRKNKSIKQMIKTCAHPVFRDGEWEDCGKIAESKERFIPLCATHARETRRLNELMEKQLEKRNSLLQKAQSLNLEPRKMPKKVSNKMVDLNKEYKILADEFKRKNPRCIVRVNQYCTGSTESVHHKRGRGRHLLDVSTFLPCCLSCHGYIEAHPKEAKEKGWSESRLATQEPHKI